MKKLLSALLSLSLCVALASCGGGATTPATAPLAAAPKADGSRDLYLTIKVGTSHNQSSFFYQGLAEFKRLVEENTKGAVNIELFDSEALGSEGEMAEGVTMGTVDACLIGSSSIAKLQPTFNMFSLPYLFTSSEHVDAVFAGEPGDFFKEKFKNESNVILLDYWDSGFRHYSNSKHPINGPQDMKGLLIRIPDNPIQAATAAALGASTSTLSFKEVYLACSNGTVDGQEGPVFAFVSDKFYEVQKYMVLDGHIYTVMGLLMNQNVYHKLAPEDQQIVTEAAQLAGLVEKKGIRESEAAQIETLKANGMTINENPDKAAWREATAAAYAQFQDTYDQTMVQTIIDYPY